MDTKLTEEQIRRREIKRFVDRLMTDPEDTERVVKMLVATGRPEAETRAKFAVSWKLKGAMTAMFLESNMDAKTAKGLRLAIPHMLSLMEVMFSPGFKNRFKGYLMVAQQKRSKGELDA